MEMKFHWNAQTIAHFKSESNYLSKEHLEDQVRNFVEDQCSLEDDETEEMLVKDLMNQVFQPMTDVEVVSYNYSTIYTTK